MNPTLNGHALIEAGEVHETLDPAQDCWDALGPEQQLGAVLGWSPRDWVKEPALSILASFRHRPIQWAEIVLTWQERVPFLSVKLLEEAIDDWRRQLGGDAQQPPLRQPATRRPRPADFPHGEWETLLLCTKDGDPKQTVNNISLLLQHASPWREDFWFDAVRGIAMVGDRPLDDTTITRIACWLGDDARMPVQSLKLVGNGCVTLCQRHPRDLLQEWLATLPPWDREPRLTLWLRHIAGAPDTPYGREVSRLLPVSMVARAQNPGCRYRYVVMLEGAENTGKSTLVRALSSPEWFYECTGGLEGKEAYMAIQGKWVAELPELHAMTKTEENRFKGFITQVDDTWIPKYSNFSTTKPRRTLFVGTLNPEGSQEYLRGQTGNTRYLPVPTGTIYPQLLVHCREQLFAEALVYYHAHPETWWQLSSAGEAEATQLRDDRRVSSVYEEKLRDWLDGQSETTWTEIAERFLHLEPAHWKDKSLQMQVAHALTGLGWFRDVVRDGKQTRKVWKPRTSVPTSTGPHTGGNRW